MRQMSHTVVQNCNKSKKSISSDWTSWLILLKQSVNCLFYYSIKKGLLLSKKGGAMTRLTKQEKETYISFDEENDYVSISTFNKSLIKKIKAYSEKYPSCIRKVQIEDSNEVLCEIKKDRFSIKFKPIRTMSDDEKKKLANNFRKNAKNLDKTNT